MIFSMLKFGEKKNYDIYIDGKMKYIEQDTLESINEFIIQNIDEMHEMDLAFTMSAISKKKKEGLYFVCRKTTSIEEKEEVIEEWIIISQGQHNYLIVKYTNQTKIYSVSKQIIDNIKGAI